MSEIELQSNLGSTMNSSKSNKSQSNDPWHYVPDPDIVDEQFDYAVKHSRDLRLLSERENEVLKRLIWSNELSNMSKKYRFDEVSFGLVYFADCLQFILQIILSPLWIGNWSVLLCCLIWRILFGTFIH